jgi:3-phosphoinositide dependent protein kinase-1
MRPDASAGIPNRSASKRAALGDAPGVPSRDDSHSERQYGTGQYSVGNGPLPPRRSSRGVAPPRMGSTPPGNTALSSSLAPTNTPLSSSPYNIEGGPLASSDEWQERGAAVSTRREYDEEGRPVVRSIKKGVKDFNFGQTLGEGSYSTVLAAQDRQTLKDYAIKVLDKRHIIKEKKVKYVNIEKDTLNRLTDHPGVVRLYYTFQDERSLYFVLDLCTGGELLGTLKRMTTFDEECTRFYSAQILDTIEYMHGRGVIHRDLKPENVLLDDQKHIKITDFGTAKLLSERQNDDGQRIYDPDSSSADNRASSFVGTAEYVSPELLTDKNACKASDLWAFGCIVYQLLAGRPPFKAGNEYQTFQKIVALDYEFPRGFPEVAKDLVERLLVLEPQQRLTIEHIKNHEFFDGITWGKGLWSQKAPRLKTFISPPNPPIRLNDNSPEDDFPPDIAQGHSTAATMLPPDNRRPQPRVITELPPPSQLDIEWSPVLTRNNERILKLGNLSVLASQNPHSPDQGGKLSRLFGGRDNKKRERLVMVTSSGRIIIAPAGGEEKKAKYEIPLLSPNTDYSSSTDAKGVTQWVVDTVS